MRRGLAIGWVIAVSAVVLGAAWYLVTSTGSVVEFYDPAANRYLLATDPAEIADLDQAGSPEGWQRTGGEFSTYSFPGFGRRAVCELRSEGRSSGRHSQRFSSSDGPCAAGSEGPLAPARRVAFYLEVPVDSHCRGNAYKVFRSRLIERGQNLNDRLTVDPTAHARGTRRGFEPTDDVLCAPVSDREYTADVVRLLEQATLGPTEPLIEEVKSTGIARWVDQQLTLNQTRYTQYRPQDRPQTAAFASLCLDDPSPPITPDKACHTYRISPSPVGWEFFRQAKSAPDQLRLRMAHVWHQIFVTSDGNGTYAYADFHQRLRDGAFEGFGTLLRKFALSPQLGEYQNWVRNMPEHNGVRPNENFARELMQLFTIGLHELADDGTPRRDSRGQPVPTYEQADIEALARVLTGFDFPPTPGIRPGWGAPNYYVGDMIPYEEHHDRGAKRFLGGRIDLPPNQSAMSDVQAALQALVDHPSTPPFIGRQLIQKLVTSSPTAGYVARVAAVFKDNGHGVRGDLAAVTRAILLDPEARGARKIDPEYGRLREPVLFWTGMIRSLDVDTDGVAPYALAAQSGQLLFLAPSVFNYFAADHRLGTSDVPGPEFGIYSSAEFLTRANQVNDLLHHAGGADPSRFIWQPQPQVIGARGTRSPTLEAFADDARSAQRLVDRLDRLFLHGTMRPAMRASILDALAAVDARSPLPRARLAIELVLTSMDYQVQR